MSQQEGINGLLNDLPQGRFFSASLTLAQARDYNNREREPDIKIQCNTFIVLQNDIEDLSIAFNEGMFGAPVTIDIHRHDNHVVFRGRIEGVWLSHAAGATGTTLKYAYGNDIVVTHVHKSIDVTIY